MNPFAETDKPRSFYATAELTQRFNLIRHLIQNSEQLIFVLAEKGYGKTTLLNQLRATAEEHWWIYSPNTTPALSVDTLIANILSAFKVSKKGESLKVLKESLHNHIAATRYNGQLPILLIDDAHMLPLETLRTIIELAMQGDNLTRMRVVLFCEPQITSILATSEFEIVQNTLTHTLDIPPLSKKQVLEYIYFHLKNTAYEKQHPFDNDVVKNIFAKSQGIPDKINHLAEHALYNFSEQKAYTTTPFQKNMSSRTKLGWSFAIVIILVAVGFWLYWQNPNWFTAISHLEQEDTITIEQSVITPKPLMTLEEASELETTEMVEMINTEETLTTHEEEMTVTESSHIIKGEEWLLEQSPNSYTLQVLGAHDPVTLERFISEYQLKNLAVFKTMYQNRNWYVLVYGVYANANDAQAALLDLPTALNEQTRPWARRLATIQKDILERKLNNMTPNEMQ